ncbi:MAG TPA: alpha/beta hydrolase [Dehalococcoidia bacterium]|nr:alpha/beta hydrolase [Dehalococcoidia bacterium]
MRKLWIALVAFFGAIIAVWRLLVRRRETIDWRDVSKIGRLIKVNGETIHYVDEGKGPAIVLIHGLGGHTYSYRTLIPDLARDHRVVALDLLGFGYSERVRDADYSHAAQARRVVGLMDALGIETASLVGHSMGGEIAMRVAAAHPERVDRLVLAASVSGDRVPTLPPTPLIKPFLSGLSQLFGKRMLRRGFYDTSKVTDEVWQAYRRPATIRGSMDGLYRILKDTRRDPPIQFASIKAPVLLMSAEYERIVPGWMSRRLRSRFPRAEHVVIGDAGHVLLEERPVECIAVIRRFVDGRGEPRAAEAAAVDIVAGPA